MLAFASKVLIFVPDWANGCTVQRHINNPESIMQFLNHNLIPP